MHSTAYLTYIFTALFTTAVVAIPIAEPKAVAEPEANAHVYLQLGQIVDPAACCL